MRLCGGLLDRSNQQIKHRVPHPAMVRAESEFPQIAIHVFCRDVNVRRARALFDQVKQNQRLSGAARFIQRQRPLQGSILATDLGNQMDAHLEAVLALDRRLALGLGGQIAGQWRAAQRGGDLSGLRQRRGCAVRLR